MKAAGARLCRLSLLLALGLGGFALPAAPDARAQPEEPGELELEPGPGLELVLDRRHRQLLVLQQGLELRRYPVAIGRPGWDTPVGRFAVNALVKEPVWVHPATGARLAPGPGNPLGSRWIGFLDTCTTRPGFNGQRSLVVRGCATAGFHGTPQRSSVGQAVSHGCVRLLDEHVRELFELVELGTPVTVLP